MHFLNGFFRHGWAFFYRFTLTYLKVLSSRILETDDIAEIIDLIKAPLRNRSFEKQEEQASGFLGKISKMF